MKENNISNNQSNKYKKDYSSFSKDDLSILKEKDNDNSNLKIISDYDIDAA